LTSERKVTSNRANARASTGPKSVRGRLRSKPNALRHGLTLSISSDPEFSEEVEKLTREIAKPRGTAEVRELARRVAEAQIELRRARYARHELLSEALSNPCYDSRASIREKGRVLSSLLRENAPYVPWSILVNYVTSTPEGPHKLATILSEEVKQLSAIDRYEHRARSRRDAAVRALDEARRHLFNNPDHGCKPFTSGCLRR
jgi:hypothetical protein